MKFYESGSWVWLIPANCGSFAQGFALDGGRLGGGEVEVEIILQHFFVWFYFLLKGQKKSEQQVIQYLSSKWGLKGSCSYSRVNTSGQKSS